MSHNHTFRHAGSEKERITLTFVKPRGGEGQNGRLKCPMGFLVLDILCKFKASRAIVILLVICTTASASARNFLEMTRLYQIYMYITFRFKRFLPVFTYNTCKSEMVFIHSWWMKSKQVRFRIFNFASRKLLLFVVFVLYSRNKSFP